MTPSSLVTNAASALAHIMRLSRATTPTLTPARKSDGASDHHENEGGRGGVGGVAWEMGERVVRHVMPWCSPSFAGMPLPAHTHTRHTHIHTHTHAHTHTHTHTNTNTHTCTHAHTHTPTHAPTRAPTHAPTHAHIHALAHIRESTEDRGRQMLPSSLLADTCCRTHCYNHTTHPHVHTLSYAHTPLSLSHTHRTVAERGRRTDSRLLPRA